jgi:hypothetical protein
MYASLSPQIKACFNAMETSYFTFNQIVYGFEHAISWEGYDASHVLGFSGSTVSPFSEEW